MGNSQFKLTRKSNKLTEVKRKIKFCFVALIFGSPKLYCRKHETHYFSPSATRRSTAARTPQSYYRTLYLFLGTITTTLTDFVTVEEVNLFQATPDHTEQRCTFYNWTTFSTVLGSIGVKFISRLLRKNYKYFYQENSDRARWAKSPFCKASFAIT